MCIAACCKVKIWYWCPACSTTSIGFRSNVTGAWYNPGLFIASCVVRKRVLAVV
jgi:hypothetical protein